MLKKNYKFNYLFINFIFRNLFIYINQLFECFKELDLLIDIVHSDFM